MKEMPHFHDAYLVGISLDEKRAAFTTETTNGERWQIIIEGVQGLQVDEFREGNIISYCEAVTETQPPRDVMERLFTPPHPCAASEYHQAHSKFLDAKCQAVQSGELVLVMMTPSYGAEVAVLGASFEASRMIA